MASGKSKYELNKSYYKRDRERVSEAKRIIAESKQPKPPQVITLDKPVETLLRQTHEKLQVIFIILKNLQVEVSQLKSEQTKLRSTILALLSDPRAREDMLSVLKDFGVQNGSQESHRPNNKK